MDTLAVQLMLPTMEEWQHPPPPTPTEHKLLEEELVRRNLHPDLATSNQYVAIDLLF